MKRFLCNILALILLAAVITIPANTFAQASENPAGSASAADGINYTNSYMGFSITLPIDWKDQYRVHTYYADPAAPYVIFTHIASEDAGANGGVLTIKRYAADATAVNGPWKLALPAEDYTYYYMMPTGVEYTGETKSGYQKLAAGIESIIQSMIAVPIVNATDLTNKLQPQPLNPEKPANPFSDVKGTDWFIDDVIYAVNLGLINGKTPTTFTPSDNLTYAEAVKLAACMHQFYTTGAISLTNGSPQWYSSYADYAKANGIISADFDWNAPATRAGYLGIFAKALPEEALEAINDIEDGAIPDVAMTHPQAAAIYLLYRAGIVQGVDAAHACNPDSKIKRSEVAAILTRMMNEEARISFNI